MRDRNYDNRFRDPDKFSEERFRSMREHRQKNKVFFGVAVALVGAALLLRTMGVLPWFSLRFSWPYVLIIIGVLVGFRHSFRNNGWWIMILIGLLNIPNDLYIMGRPYHDFAWPVAVIIAGLVIALKPRRAGCYTRHGYSPTVSSIVTESTLNIDATFGGRKEVVTSKDFKGGLVSVTFAGCELNLTQADFSEPSVVLECRVSFGGLEIAIPSHWEIQNEINPSFGSVEDARTIQTATSPENRKILILRGSCSFGSVELKSY